MAEAVPKSELGGIVVLDFGGQYTQLIARQNSRAASFLCGARVQFADRKNPRAHACGSRAQRRPEFRLR